MHCDDVLAAMREKFDSGETLADFIDPHLEACPRCLSYLRELARLETHFHNLPLETPPPRLLAHVSTRVLREAGISIRRRILASAALAALCATTITIGILYPVAFNPIEWWKWAVQSPQKLIGAGSGQSVVAELGRLVMSAQAEVSSLLHMSTWTWWVVLCALIGVLLILARVEFKQRSAIGKIR